MKKIISISIVLIAVCVICLALYYREDIMAYYASSDTEVNRFTVGDIDVTITEPNYVDDQIIVPNQTIAKDPTFTNEGSIKAHIRAQVYVPISDSIKYVDQNEQIVTPSEEIELFSYTINDGWEEVVDNPSDTYKFNGIYEDSKGNRYKVHTYKYVNTIEKEVEPGETISTPLFDEVTVINYLDTDEAINLKMPIVALSCQVGNNADEMWERFKNQNQAGIVGVE